MTKKQKNNLIRIIAAAAMLVALHFATPYICELVGQLAGTGSAGIGLAGAGDPGAMQAAASGSAGAESAGAGLAGAGDPGVPGLPARLPAHPAE